jgi:hypothetical protein
MYLCFFLWNKAGGTVLSTLMGVTFFKEKMSMKRLICLGMIVAGVVGLEYTWERGGTERERVCSSDRSSRIITVRERERERARERETWLCGVEVSRSSLCMCVCVCLCLKMRMYSLCWLALSAFDFYGPCHLDRAAAGPRGVCLLYRNASLSLSLSWWRKLPACHPAFYTQAYPHHHTSKYRYRADGVVE